MNALLLGLAGAISGALTAAAIDLIPLGDIPGTVLFGYCVGLGAPGCSGLPGGIYLYPGLIFGLAFAILLVSHRRLRTGGAAALAIIAMLANAAAVFVWTAIFAPAEWLLEKVEFDTGTLIFGTTGAIAGGVGGGLLGFAALRLLGATGWWRAITAGAALGLLLPLLTMFHGGEFAFYVPWQAGYADIGALAVRLAIWPSRPRRLAAEGKARSSGVPDRPAAQTPNPVLCHDRLGRRDHRSQPLRCRGRLYRCGRRLHRWRRRAWRSRSAYVRSIRIADNRRWSRWKAKPMRSADDRIFADAETPADFSRRQARVGPQPHERRIALGGPGTHAARHLGYSPLGAEMRGANAPDSPIIGLLAARSRRGAFEKNPSDTNLIWSQFQVKY